MILKKSHIPVYMTVIEKNEYFLNLINNYYTSVKLLADGEIDKRDRLEKDLVTNMKNFILNAIYDTYGHIKISTLRNSGDIGWFINSIKHKFYPNEIDRKCWNMDHFWVDSIARGSLSLEVHRVRTILHEIFSDDFVETLFTKVINEDTKIHKKRKNILELSKILIMIDHDIFKNYPINNVYEEYFNEIFSKEELNRFINFDEDSVIYGYSDKYNWNDLTSYIINNRKDKKLIDFHRLNKNYIYYFIDRLIYIEEDYKGKEEIEKKYDEYIIDIVENFIENGESAYITNLFFNKFMLTNVGVYYYYRSEIRKRKSAKANEIITKVIQRNMNKPKYKRLITKQMMNVLKS